MRLRGLAFLWQAASLVSTACGKGPTSPSALAPAATLPEEARAEASGATDEAVAPPAQTPLPPEISITPPRALGVTRYMAFGDSITFGVTSSFLGGYVLAAANGSYPDRLQTGLNSLHAPQQF